LILFGNEAIIVNGAALGNEDCGRSASGAWMKPKPIRKEALTPRQKEQHKADIASLYWIIPGTIFMILCPILAGAPIVWLALLGCLGPVIILGVFVTFNPHLIPDILPYPSLPSIHYKSLVLYKNNVEMDLYKNNLKATLANNEKSWKKRGMQTPILALDRSYAHYKLGHAVEAQTCAEEALKLIDQSGDTYLYMRDAAVLAVYNAMVLQGQFTEAAAYLRSYLPISLHSNLFVFLVAWALYLGEEYDNAKSMLTFMSTEPDPKLKGNRDSMELPPKYAAILTYMRFDLKVQPRLSPAEHTLIIEYFFEWDAEAKYHLGNPYGARLARVLGRLLETNFEP
jgi:tetratricopeptide (TPR) repeat protein